MWCLFCGLPGSDFPVFLFCRPFQPASIHRSDFRRPSDGDEARARAFAAAANSRAGGQPRSKVKLDLKRHSLFSHTLQRATGGATVRKGAEAQHAKGESRLTRGDGTGS